MSKRTKSTWLLIPGFLFMTFIVPASAQNYGLVWSDEFENPVINVSNWYFETGTGDNGWGNNELQYYTNRPANAVVQNGELRIIAKKENYGGKSYTSARMKTQNLRNWKYGKIEARLKIPKGQGLWPAFWMLGQNIGQVGWPSCGEIDIMEHVNNEPFVHGTIHWNDGGPVSYGGPSTTTTFPTGYHTYSIEWTSSIIRWLIDGTQFWAANIQNSVNGTDEFHKPHFMILNIAVGGNWPGNPNGATLFPDTMHVDYVRVYQQVTDVNEIQNVDESTLLYPNPAFENITLSSDNFKAGTPFSIYTVTGKKVLSGTLTGTSTTISINPLSAGLHFLQIEDEKRRSLKIVKQE